MGCVIVSHSSPTDLSSLAVNLRLCMFALRSTASIIYCAVHILCMQHANLVRDHGYLCSQIHTFQHQNCIVDNSVADPASKSFLCLQKGAPTLRDYDLNGINIHTCCLASQDDCRTWACYCM